MAVGPGERFWPKGPLVTQWKYVLWVPIRRAVYVFVEKEKYVQISGCPIYLQFC